MLLGHRSRLRFRTPVRAVVRVLVLATIAAIAAACSLGRASHDVTSASGAKLRIESWQVHSSAAHGDFTEWTVVPAQHDQHTPLLIMLHGRGGDAHGWTSHEMTDALGRLGRRAPIVLGVQTTTSSYWHNRATGRYDDYVVREVIPAARRRYHLADSTRVAIGGHSMGGFGAFDIALHHRGMFCAVGGHEPAVWRTGGETAPGAFDNADDFARNDLIRMVEARTDPFGGAAVQLDYGDRDYFIIADKALIAAIRASATRHFTTRVWPGTHGMNYVRAHLDTTIRFYADALASCHARAGS